MIVFSGCSEPEVQEISDKMVEPVDTLIYVTFAGHIEDDLKYSDCKVYEQKRAQLLEFAKIIEKSYISFIVRLSPLYQQGIIT